MDEACRPKAFTRIALEAHRKEGVGWARSQSSSLSWLLDPARTVIFKRNPEQEHAGPRVACSHDSMLKAQQRHWR